MRAMPLALTCCAVLLSPIATTDVQAEAVKVTPELTVFTEDESASTDGRPTVLRGSATRRGTVDGRYGGRNFQPTRFQQSAGDKLWLTDPTNGEVVVCDQRRTSRVGSRFIRCIRDRLPYDVYE